jgi:hypothetical protein
MSLVLTPEQERLAAELKAATTKISAVASLLADSLKTTEQQVYKKHLLQAIDALPPADYEKLTRDPAALATALASRLIIQPHVPGSPSTAFDTDAALKDVAAAQQQVNQTIAEAQIVVKTVSNLLISLGLAAL